ncbi:MAG: collagen binding domain-containing protein [Oscillospiraceae bacterium]
MEQCTAHGYVLDSEPVPFTVDGTQTVVTVTKYNTAQKGTITVSKSGEVFSSVMESDGVYQPVYSVSGLAGAVYEIYADEDIVTLDGTVRAKKGELVAEIETGSDGSGTSGLLYLGRYKIVEKKSPFGMTLNPDPQIVELTYAGQEVEITTVSSAFYNERQKVQIDLTKVLEQDERFGIGMNGEILSVQFGLYAAEPLEAADGSVIPKDGLLEIVSCDENGKAVFSTDIPAGAKLYAKEYSTDGHYQISGQIYPVEYEYAGQDVAVVHISVNGGEPISNEIIRGSVMGKKVDEDGFAICGAVFGLFKPDETTFTEETALLTAESNPIGVFRFESVPFGNWVIRELKPAPAFVLNEALYPVTVSQEEEVIEIEIENRFITGSVQTTKVDAEYPDHKLTGAVFEVYVDVDGDQAYRAETDRFIGEMSEVETGVYRMDGLQYNGYFLHEKTSPEGFLKDDNYYYFEIREDGETVTVENEADVGFVNQPITGKLELTKKDISDGKLLPGVGFRIWNEQGEIVTEGYTDQNGIAEFTLRYGKYTYQEFDPLDNYQPDETEYPFEIRENGEIVKAEMTNERIPTPEVPQTGDDTNLGFWIGLGAVALGALVSLVIIQIKRKKDDE